MLHPDLELRFVDPTVGFGVFATKNIPQGTITWALDPLDQIISATKASSLSGALLDQLHRYSWRTANGDRILCWDLGRFMNHSCDPTSAGPGRIEMEVALRDIQAGEEVTCHYGTFNLEEDLICQCGSPQCNGLITASAFGQVAPLLDTKVRTAFTSLLKVRQPLWPLMSKWHSTVEAAVAAPEQLPSLLANQWHEPATPIVCPLPQPVRSHVA